MGMLRDVAADYANRAAGAATNQTEAQAEAVGSGLAAVAFALLELADKVDDVRRELAKSREDRQQ